MGQRFGSGGDLKTSEGAVAKYQIQISKYSGLQKCEEGFGIGRVFVFLLRGCSSRSNYPQIFPFSKFLLDKRVWNELEYGSSELNRRFVFRFPGSTLGFQGGG